MKSIFILIFSFAILIGNCKENKFQKFDPEKWKNGNQMERGNMATDLLESKYLMFIAQYHEMI